HVSIPSMPSAMAFVMPPPFVTVSTVLPVHPGHPGRPAAGNRRPDRTIIGDPMVLGGRMRSPGWARPTPTPGCQPEADRLAAGDKDAASRTGHHGRHAPDVAGR